MSGFGAKLRREREGRGFTLDQVAEATRINLRYLTALESDDLAKLPGTVFNKGYVRAVAKFVGADEESLIRDYVREEEAQEQAGRISRPDDVMDLLAKAADRNRPEYAALSSASWFSGRTAILVLAAVGLVVAGWAYFRFTGPGDDSDSGAPIASVQPSRTETAQPVPLPAAQEANAEGSPTDAGVKPETIEDPPATTPAGPRDDAPVRDDEARARATEPVVEISRPEPATTRTTTREPEPEAAIPSPSATAPTRPAKEPAAVESGISVTEFGVGTGVVNRRLVGESDRFEPGTRVWFWTRVMGGKSGEPLHHVWLHEGREAAATELTLGGSHWRTQSRKTLSGSSLGSWAVEARDANGRVVARSEFVCVPTVSD